MNKNTKWKSCPMIFIFFISVFINPRCTSGLRGVSIYRPDSFFVYKFPVSQTVFITEISFTFSTESCEGVILEMTSKDTDSFYRFLLNKNGDLIVSLKSGDEVRWVIVPVNRNPFCNGHEHSLHFRREGHDVTIGVNNSKETENRFFSNLYLPFSKPNLLVIGGTSQSVRFPHFRGCIVQVKVVNYKTRGDPNPTMADPIAIYHRGKSNLLEVRNVYPCDYVPTTPRAAGQRMSKTSTVAVSSSMSTFLFKHPSLLGVFVVGQVTCRLQLNFLVP